MISSRVARIHRHLKGCQARFSGVQAVVPDSGSNILGSPTVSPGDSTSGSRSFLSSSSSASRSSRLSDSKSTHRPQESFIDRVKRVGVNAILGRFVTTGVRFDSVLEGMEVTRMDSPAGTVEVELEVSEALSNAYGTLHGGATSTLVDVVGTLALLTRDPTRAGVSVELSTSFLAAAKVGSRIRCIGRVSKAGRRLGFTTVEIWTLKKDGGGGSSHDDSHDGHRGAGESGPLVLDRLVAEGRHTKAL